MIRGTCRSGSASNCDADKYKDNDCDDFDGRCDKLEFREPFTRQGMDQKYNEKIYCHCRRSWYFISPVTENDVEYSSFCCDNLGFN